MKSEQWIGVDEAGAMLKLHPNTVRTLVNTQKIPGIRLGSSYRIDRERLEKMIEAKLDACELAGSR